MQVSIDIVHKKIIINILVTDEIPHAMLLSNNNLDACRVAIDFKTKLLYINNAVLSFSIKYTLIIESITIASITILIEYKAVI
jgi:hypothetical protein